MGGWVEAGRGWGRSRWAGVEGSGVAGMGDGEEG